MVVSWATLWMDGKKKTKAPRACEVGARGLGR